MRKFAKKDDNQKQIEKDLKRCGYSVVSTANMGDGFPDIIVGVKGRNYLFEIKDGEKIPSKQRLTPLEKQFHDTWNGQVNIITTSEEIITIIAGK